jgi:hypothetical protein
MPADRTPPSAPERVVIDALEHPAVALVEGLDGASWTLPRAWLPAGAREGDVLRVAVGPGEGASRVTLTIDRDATEERRLAAKERHERIPRAPDGDLDL